MRLGVNGRFYGARITGAQRFAREVTARLPGRVEEVLLFVPRDGPEAAGLPAGVRVLRGRTGGRLWEQWELPGQAARAGVHVMLHPANAAPLRGTPGVVVVHDLLPLSHPRFFRPAYRAWTRLAHVAPARRARAVITVSAWSAREIQRLTGIPAESVTVIRQGAGPLDAPATDAAVDEVRRRFGLEGPYFLGVAGGDARKGSAFLSRVWDHLGPGPPAPLVLVGGSYRRVHRDRGVKTGPHLRQLGHMGDEDLRALYTGAVAMLYPSVAEGFGRPPLEALACGTRVAVTPYGAAEEVLGSAADVWPRNLAPWADGVRRLADEPPEERAARVEAGRRWAATYSWDEAVAGVVAICRAAAREPS